MVRLLLIAIQLQRACLSLCRLLGQAPGVLSSPKLANQERGTRTLTLD